MELKLDQWATTPPPGYPGSIPPPSGKRAAGFTNGEEPAAGYFNHAWDALADTQNELANFITGAGLTRSETDLSQVLQGVLMLVGRAQLKAALTTVRAVHDTAIGPKTLRALARAPATRQVIAVGTAGAIQANTGPNTDFAAQTVAAGSSYAGDFNDIAYDATLGLFIAVGTVGEIQTSPGNGTWTRRANGGEHLLRVATNGLGRCVAVGAGQTIKYSINGTSWSTATSPFSGTPDILGVAFGAGLFVVASSSGAVASSPDGITWTVRHNLARPYDNMQLVYDAGLGFVFHFTGEVFRSVDGITWSQIHAAAGDGVLVASSFAWLMVPSSADGTSAAVRYSMSPAGQAPDFTVDYVATGALSWMKFINSQLWALSGSKIYLGGIL